MAVLIDTEQVMRDMGRRRFREALAKARAGERVTSVASGERRLMRAMIATLSEAIRATTTGERQKGHTRGPRPRAVTLMKGIKPEVSAVITLRTVLDGLAMQASFAKVGVQVGRRIEDEARLERFRREQPALFKHAMRKIKGSTSYSYMHRSMVFTMNHTEGVTPWESWSGKDALLVGTFLLHLLVDPCGLLEIKQVVRKTSKKYRTINHLSPTEKAMVAIQQGEMMLEETAAWFLPTVVPPRDWSTPYDGGYHDYDLTLVKNPSPRQREMLANCHMPEVYAAVNRLQSTKWKVNRDVLVTAQEIYLSGLECDGMPSRTPYPKPVRGPELPPEDKPTDQLTPEEAALLKPHKRELHAWRQDEIGRRSKLIQASRTIEAAEMLQSVDELYFPYQLDFRGRAYAKPLFLNPQGHDLARGLIHFAEGKPVGDEGGHWLAVHGANTWGEDKLGYADRVEWVMENMDRILEVADDPITNHWWMEASRPWSFLAWCLEWAEFMAQDGSPEFVSHLPIALDGTCNGLQHLAAMMRDPDGAEATNLTKAEKPQDIYARVADNVKEKCEADAEQCHDVLAAALARQWLSSGLLDRKVVKRQVMTVPYGATKTGMHGQLMEYLGKVRASTGQPLPFEEPSGWDAARYLTDRIWAAIHEVVVSAQTAMTWLQECARIATKEGRPVRWVTPHGFPVVQECRKAGLERVATKLMGRVRVTQFYLQRDLKGLDLRRQVNSIAPNFVHSLDGCHMMRTILASSQELSWAMIHDSYATHAADTEEVSRTLREQFVQLYMESSPMASFREAVQEEGRQELPAVPEKGELNLREVLEAEFFFG